VGTGPPPVSAVTTSDAPVSSSWVGGATLGSGWSASAIGPQSRSSTSATTPTVPPPASEAVAAAATSSAVGSSVGVVVRDTCTRVDGRAWSAARTAGGALASPPGLTRV
jgi:hypothetical protein